MAQGALTQGLDKVIKPFSHDTALSKRLGAWRPPMARNTLLVKDEIGKVKYVAPPPVSDFVYFVPPRPVCKRDWHVPDCLDWQIHRISNHHTESTIDFISLGRRALDSGRCTAGEFQDFYKHNRHLESKCCATCNCRDLNSATGFKRVLTKKDKVPIRPDPHIPTEWEAGCVNMLMPNMYGRHWLLREQAKQFHEKTLTRVHKHVEIHREVNRDWRFNARHKHWREKALEMQAHRIRTIPKLPAPNPKFASVKADISTFSSDKKRTYAFSEAAARKAGLRNPVIPAPVVKNLYNPRLPCPCKPPRIINPELPTCPAKPR